MCICLIGFFQLALMLLMCVVGRWSLVDTVSSIVTIMAIIEPCTYDFTAKGSFAPCMLPLNSMRVPYMVAWLQIAYHRILIVLFNRISSTRCLCASDSFCVKLFKLFISLIIIMINYYMAWSHIVRFFLNILWPLIWYLVALLCFCEVVVNS